MRDTFDATPFLTGGAKDVLLGSGLLHGVFSFHAFSFELEDIAWLAYGLVLDLSGSEGALDTFIALEEEEL